MTESHLIESKGKEILIEWLKNNGRSVKESDNPTFDLIVDDEYAEIKAKKCSWDTFDLISLSSNQKKELCNKLKKIFIVLNVFNSDQSEIIEIDACELEKISCNEICSYEWNKSHLKRFRI